MQPKNASFSLFFQKNLWLLLGLGTLLLYRLAAATPQYVEQFYSRGIFLGVRWFFDNTLAWLPIPGLFLFYAIAFGFLGRCFFVFFDKKIERKFWAE
ncbi:MAG: hypothetical protein HC817_14005 [Saprospiraceae bacterium]|nr:hypothetical protein [Saprospiraceae bacterium]